MAKYLLLAAGVALLGACGDHGGRHVTVETPPSYTTDLLVQATNYDGFDYALWLEWQDGSGAWNQIYLFSVYADPAVGPTTNFEMLVASPGIPYTVLLSDPYDGYIYDSTTLWLPQGSFSDIRFQVIGGVLVGPS